MRHAAFAVLLASPAFADVARPDLAGFAEPALPFAPAVVPADRPLGEADEWHPGAARLAAILGPDGVPSPSHLVGETFDDVPHAEDARLVQADHDDM